MIRCCLFFAGFAFFLSYRALAGYYYLESYWLWDGTNFNDWYFYRYSEVALPTGSIGPGEGYSGGTRTEVAESDYHDGGGDDPEGMEWSTTENKYVPIGSGGSGSGGSGSGSGSGGDSGSVDGKTGRSFQFVREETRNNRTVEVYVDEDGNEIYHQLPYKGKDGIQFQEQWYDADGNVIDNPFSEDDATGGNTGDDTGGNSGDDTGDNTGGNTGDDTTSDNDLATEATLQRILSELRKDAPTYDDTRLLAMLRGIASGNDGMTVDILNSISALRSEVAAKDLSVTVNPPSSSFNDSNIRSDIQDVKAALTDKDTTVSDNGASAVDADASELKSAFSAGFAEIGGAVTNGVSGGVSGAVDGLKGALDVSSLLSASSPQTVGFGNVEIYGKQIDLSISKSDYPSFFRFFDIIRAVFSALWCAAFLVTLVLLLRRLFSVSAAVVRWLLDMIPKVLHIVAQ